MKRYTRSFIIVHGSKINYKITRFVQRKELEVLLKALFISKFYVGLSILSVEAS